MTVTLTADEIVVIQEALSAAADERVANLTDDQRGDIVWLLMRHLDHVQRNLKETDR